MNLQFMPQVQFPLTWPLNGMEFDIGGGVDNGVTTSGKEVQEALVNVRLHR